MLLDEA
jgi:hypothetical protein